MCGIIGYAGHRPAVPIVIEGLHRLEYRGYDSAGIAFTQGGVLQTVRSEGKLCNLEEKLASQPNMMATVSMGHTRWATHGVPEERNAHPHIGGAGLLSIVHNGIIENYQEIKAELAQKGYVFSSDTDTEVLAHLIADKRATSPTMFAAFLAALRHAQGAYAVAIISPEEPNTIYAARMSAPLLLGVGVGENFVASDIPAFLSYTRDVVFLDDGEAVRLDANSFEVFDCANGLPKEKKIHHIKWDMQSAQKGGFKHYMLKEITEQPKVITDCLTGRINTTTGKVELPELDDLPIPERIQLVACGTSLHAGMWGRHLFESWAGIPVSPEIASEFRYRDVILNNKDMVLVISQSGETADTLAAMRKCKGQSGTVAGLCNVVGSSITREADVVLYTQAGPEISVASTKAMCSQMVMLALMALYYGERKGTLDPAIRKKALETLQSLPALLEEFLPKLRDKAKELAQKFSATQSFFFLGRGHAYPLALEGALKLKELSYIHAEGYAFGEMKHGPIALIDQSFPTFAIALDDGLYSKTKSNIAEVQSRNGPIIALMNPENPLKVDHPWILPRVWGPFGGFLALTAMQLFSYETADFLGKDVDQPRNLAKSVTVE